MAEENNNRMHLDPESVPGKEAESEEQEHPSSSGWREIFRQAFDRARREQRAMNRKDKGRDRSGSLVLLAGAALAVLLLFLAVFSSPNTAKKTAMAERAAPDLGRRVMPGQPADVQGGSATPLLNAQAEEPASQNTQEVTPEDVNRTARPVELPKAPSRLAANSEGPYALGRIDFADETPRAPAKENPEAPQGLDSDNLKEASLVFVRSAQSSLARTTAPSSFVPEESPLSQTLPIGTRLVARVQSAVSSAVKTPVAAAIEYNYERNGQIVVPAGTTAIGSLDQADRSGYVGIHFYLLEFPDGSSEKIDAAAMSLDYGVLKGRVSGKRTGKNFFVRAFTGLGEAATYLVGSGGPSAPLSESALLRDRMATNIGTAGDQQLENLAFNQNIVVTLPANTRFYIVIQKEAAENDGRARPARAPQTSDTELPTIEEMRQLMQLKQELGEMYHESTVPNAEPVIPQH